MMSHNYHETGKIGAEGTSAGVVRIKVTADGGASITTLELPPDNAEAFGKDVIAKAQWVREHVEGVK